MDGRNSRRARLQQGCFMLDKLVNLCLLEKNHNGDDESLKMHDLVRGMALKINEGKYMVRAGEYDLKEIPKEEEWTEDLEKVSLMQNDIQIIPDGISPNCPNLSTLLLCDSMSLEVIPDSFFSKMQGLCTLDLCSTEIVMLPDSLSEMISLKALLLESCSHLKTVPYLGKLKALRELNISYIAIEEVPHGVEELLNLKFLSLVATYLKRLPRRLLLKLRHLQCLKLPVEVLVPTEEIVILKEVEQFRGRLDSVRSFNCFLKSRQHEALCQVQIGKCFNNDGNGIFGDYDREQEMYLSKCNLEGEKVLGSVIKSLTIRKCEGLSNCLMDDFSPSNHPKSLKTLIIEKCGGIECVLTSSRESLSLFLSLELIHLEALKDFNGLIQKREIGAAPASAVFSSLKTLTMEKCKRVGKLGLPVSGVPNLIRLVISQCGEIEEIFEDEGRGSITLPKFCRLTLFGLPRLKFVCKATMICNSFDFIDIFQCPELMKKLPLHLELDAPAQRYREIRVEREWWESLEWDNPNLLQLLQPIIKFQG